MKAVKEMLVLVINTGSSSIKYSVIDMNGEKAISKGVVECIGFNNAKIKYQKNDDEWCETNVSVDDHEKAVQLIIETLTHSKYGVLESMSSISALGHRVVHGGEKLFKSVIIDDDVMELISEHVGLAPLHMPHMINSIKVFKKLLPEKPMVAVFDTAFHQTIPEKAFLYAIPYEYYLKHGVRRYGFHGISHNYVSAKAVQMLNKPAHSLKIITCHLGNGSSIAAIDKGRSVDTSMGFTPIAGVPMGTRCGDLDAAVIGYLMEKERLSYTEVETILNNESGFLGLSGVSSDCRELERLSKNGDKRAKVAIDVFCYNIKKYIGAYAAAMNGVDCVAFTGGIGENSPQIRSEICGGLDFIGLHICNNKNFQSTNTNSTISSDTSKVKILKIKTDEELLIALEAMKILNCNHPMESMS